MSFLDKALKGRGRERPRAAEEKQKRVGKRWEARDGKERVLWEEREAGRRRKGKWVIGGA